MKRTFLLTALLVVTMVPGLAWACSIVDFSGRADCYGWSATATVHFGSIDRNAVMNYTVTLTNVDTAEVVDVQTGSQNLGFVEWATISFDYGGTWADLCGNFKVTGLFVMTGIDLYQEASFMTTFTCICDEPPDGCFNTPGYWKTHPEDPTWPAVGFAIGGVFYTNAELIAIMEMSIRGDATIPLASHLIAAKLNVMGGAGDADYFAAIAEADDLLVMYPLGSKPKGDAKEEINAVKDFLVLYNELGCDGVLMKAMPVQEETTSWGSLKSLYR